ncbi:PEP-utilizing enzyme [Gordonia amicalis]|uniref:PEP-utilizing enzyme n=1 Tax=Gordonia amicalis TaxID=89053 RepID=UPI0002A643CE|nr:PEP-utilizing enzyme [Gordonia amicalis]MBA5848976.1 phosphoenolpyruvate-utilizing protein [Gordonia amicalis]MDV7174174.1 PEP-utilizing enzyme [Gordonia amicalis]NKX77830.1 phosphoenolpyruvate-utilizing protein [Gordonia amicalis]GAC52688.1 hypothetical protein GOAMI_14_00760 [Gordonia amicalis NBRC 100051 = JCM 11271]
MPTPTDPIKGSSEPGRYWTSTNLGEACPEVMSPMCWSLWGPATEQGLLYPMYSFGVIPRSKLVVSDDPNELGVSCFYGRQALNVDVIKKTMAAVPGLSADDFERDLMGSVRPDAPKFSGSPGRVPVIAAKAPVALMRTRKRLERLYEEMYADWLATVVDGEPSQTPIERLVQTRADFERVFSVHCVWRFIFQGAQSAVTGAAEKLGEPGLVDQLLSGVGDLNEARMADDLWRLGRGEIGEAEFLSSWGYHGPNEGNLFATVWREDPRAVRSLAASLAQRAERPAARASATQQVGSAAEARLLAATPALQRPVTRWLVRKMRDVIRSLQVGKAAYLIAIDRARAAARTFGRQQVDLGALREVDDVFFLTVEECEDLAAGRLSDAQRIVDTRRATREGYKAMVLPVAFYGMPEPERIDDDADDVGAVELSGAASGGGVVEGRARVLSDPSEDIELDDGDILVCRFTDPSWAPLMAMAEALVIDIGGSASHGAVVARELGVPYVIGTESGTRRIGEGDRILVDGERNLVKVTERARDGKAVAAG